MEFRKVCSDLGVIISEVEAIAVFGVSDVNGDGDMNFHEFLHIYMSEAVTGISKAPDRPQSPQ